MVALRRAAVLNASIQCLEVQPTTTAQLASLVGLTKDPSLWVFKGWSNRMDLTWDPR